MLTPEQMADPLKALREVNRAAMQMYDNAPPHLKLKVLRTYDIKTPEEEALVQLILDEMETPKVSKINEFAVRQAMREAESRGEQVNSPEKEQYWESELEKARKEDSELLQNTKKARKEQFQTETSGGGIPPNDEGNDNDSSLLELNGIGAKSIEKLKAAHINTAEEFLALSDAQKESIVGPIVAAKFKT